MAAPIKLVADLGEEQTPRVALDQPGAEPLLEIGEVPARGRRRQAERFSRARNAAALRRFDEKLHLHPLVQGCLQFPVERDCVSRS